MKYFLIDKKYKFIIKLERKPFLLALMPYLKALHAVSILKRKSFVFV